MYKDGFTVNHQYTHGQPINATYIKRYEDPLGGKFELEDTGRHYMFYQSE
jgi:hypothetical protein